MPEGTMVWGSFHMTEINMVKDSSGNEYYYILDDRSGHPDIGCEPTEQTLPPICQ
jgi:hypothetical protein